MEVNYDLISYDVLGNDEDGYEVNDAYDTGITIPLYNSEKEFEKRIRKYFNGRITIDYIDDINIYINDKHGRPLAALVLITE